MELTSTEIKEHWRKLQSKTKSKGFANGPILGPSEVINEIEKLERINEEDLIIEHNHLSIRMHIDDDEKVNLYFKTCDHDCGVLLQYHESIKLKEWLNRVVG